MSELKPGFQYFVLTRFNLFLWQKDKEGRPVRNLKWLEHRFLLFEHYCLPSIKSQTCQDFDWIVLFDSTTPEQFKERIIRYQHECPQLVPVFVAPQNGRFFARVFQEEMIKRMKAHRVISTYLDNDDALNIRFIEDMRKRAASVPDGTFFYYDEGYQYYTEDKYLIQIHYPRNHFVSVVEKGDAAAVKGVFGYGGHYYIDQINGIRIEHIKTRPMWCEVIHEKNMLNDANFLFRTRMVRNEDILRNEFALNETLQIGGNIYLFKFLPRYVKTLTRRVKHKIIGREW